MYFRYFVIISSWKKARPFSWTNLNPLHKRMLSAKFGWTMPSGSGEEDENVKSLRQQRRRRQRRRRTAEKNEEKSLLEPTAQVSEKNFKIFVKYVLLHYVGNFKVCHFSIYWVQPWSHWCPRNPESQPFKHVPFTWWHCSFSKQFPHTPVQLCPKVLLSHSEKTFIT